MLQRVIHQIGGGLLHFLIVETKDGQRGIEIGLKADALALEGLAPALRQLFEAIPYVVLAQVQDELSAFQSGVVQEHGDEPNDPLTALFRLFEDVALFLRQAANRARQQ